MKKFFIVFLLLIMGCDSGAPAGSGGGMLPPVEVASVNRQSMPVKYTAIGTVEASANVEIKARVDGQLLTVHFQEGQEVKEGELLFTIDPAPYKAELLEATSKLESERAQTQKAMADLRRYEGLLKNKVISTAQYEEYVTAAQVRRSSQAALEASVESARLKLSWCYIHAPISGVSGSLYVHGGNIIKANSESLVNIQQVRPIDVSFTLPEQYLSSLRKYMAQNGMQVRAVIPGMEATPEEGVISFVDNAINTATGTIKLKASFVNQHKYLWPGQYVNIDLIFTTLENALVVPAGAVQTGPASKYVFVLEPEQQTVSIRQVAPGLSVDNMTIINAGLEEGEVVVTQGQLRLTGGVKVSVIN